MTELELLQKSYGAIFSERINSLRIASYGDPTQEYTAAKTSCALFHLTGWETVKVAGKDASSLLHRITMNEMRNMKPGEMIVNALPDAKGKVVDAFFQVLGQDDIELITGAGKGNVLLEWIDRFVFIEDVQCQKADNDYDYFLLCGAAMPSLLANKAQKFLVSQVEMDGVPITQSGVEGLLPEGVLVKAPRDKSHHVFRYLVESENCRPAGSTAYQALRVEQGVPAHGSEITNEVNPYEAGLSKYISYTKGCYTGQEVIARLDTYDKIKFIYSRVRCRLKSGFEQTLPVAVFANGKEVGELTSLCEIPGQAGEYQGIARIRRKILEGEAQLTIHSAKEPAPLSVIDR